MAETPLGGAVRRLRHERQLSLRALAERTGFSASFLSQVENGQASPSISSMERIAMALGVPMGRFFQDETARPSDVVRVADRAVLDSGWSSAQLEALGGDGPSGRFDSVLVSLQPGGKSGNRTFTAPADEFALVLEGSVVLTLGDEVQVLQTGDAVTIRMGRMRRWQNLSGSLVRLVIVSAR